MGSFPWGIPDLAREETRESPEPGPVGVHEGTTTGHMSCLKCKGFMMIERHYTLVNRRLYARCLNCGFWLDLADLLRFLHKVIASGVRGHKVRETLTL